MRTTLFATMFINHAITAGMFFAVDLSDNMFITNLQRTTYAELYVQRTNKDAKKYHIRRITNVFTDYRNSYKYGMRSI